MVKEYLADPPAEELFDCVLIPAIVLVRREAEAQGICRPRMRSSSCGLHGR